MTYDSRNSHPAISLLAAPCSSRSLPHEGEIWKKLTPFRHLGYRFSLFKECASRTNVNAFATTSTSLRRTPRLVEISDHTRVGSAPHDIPGVSALDLIANADASRAKYAAVVVNHEPFVRRID